MVIMAAIFLIRNLKRITFILAYSILGLGCMSKEDEAKRLGFESVTEMEEMTSNGYKSKKEYDEARERELAEYNKNIVAAWEKGFIDPNEMKAAAKLNIHDGTEYMLTMAKAQRKQVIQEIKERKNRNQLEQVLDPFTSTARIFETFKQNGGLNNNSDFYGTTIERLRISYSEDGDFDYAILTSPRIDFNDSSFDFAIFALAHACEIPTTEFIRNEDDRYANAFAVNKRVKCSINSNTASESMDLTIKRNTGQIKIKEIPLETLKTFTGRWAKYKNECPKKRINRSSSTQSCYNIYRRSKRILSLNAYSR
jgi:hypothetical protein